MRPPELMQTPRVAGSLVLLFLGTMLKPMKVPATVPHRFRLMLASLLLRVTSIFGGAS